MNRWTGTAEGISTAAYAQQLFKPVPMTYDQMVPVKSENAGNQNFGSAHLTGTNMSMADGSLKFINHDIDPYVHMVLGARNDGQMYQGKRYDYHD